MLPILVSVFATLPVFKPPDSFEPEWLVPADASFTGGANYVIYNTINGKRYEGETVNLHERYGEHLRIMKNENAKYHNYHLYRAMRKHGIENFRLYFRRTFKFGGREKLSNTERKAFNGKCLAIIQTTEKRGEISFTASSDGLKSNTIKFKSTK